MASTGCSAFSPDGQYWAYCGRDGKLKIWETSTSRLKQEFIPDLHLSSPCSVLEWITVGQQSANTTPWKKRKRKSVVEDTDQKHIIAMGSVNGNVTLYDISTASINKILENGHSAALTALTWSSSAGLFTAADDHQIVEWNIQDNGIKCKWKSGKSKITALAVLPDGQTIISADRLMKWWDLKTKQVIGSFTGHANPIIFLRPVQIDANSCYLISGASGDSYLSVWPLNERTKNQTSVGSLTMQDDPVSLHAQVNENSQITILSTNRSGQAHVFVYQPNGKCSKPLKPSVTVLIASESRQKEGIQSIPIQSAYLTLDNKMLLAYSSLLTLTFEKIEPDFSDKVQALVRSEIKWSKERKEEAVSKVKSVETEGNVEYLSPGTTGAINAIGKRIRDGVGSQLPLKDRLENLSLNPEINTTGHAPTKGANMVQLLMQGLNSKDKNILMTVLQNQDEKIIKNTITKLPIAAISPLLKELTIMLQSKMFLSRIAVMWLKTLIVTHAAHLLSLPDIGDALSPILGLIDAKLLILTELSRLRGRVALVTGQISHLNEKQNTDITEECLLVYQDPDSSDNGTDGEMEAESGSDDNWEETSDHEEGEEEVNEDMENGRSDDDDDVSMCS
ncbi:hypothetical protein PV326_001058 [Microctonus aethiopoides]|nr:hypothetical protein PV326_001058 [Microctonus aethiopoides]